jgi:hypothetical protein
MVAEAPACPEALTAAEQAARSITNPGLQTQILARVAAVADAGHHDRAEAFARSITYPDTQARALAVVASVADPARARACIADALAVGWWAIPLKELARVDLVALSAFADELTDSTGPSGHKDNGPLPGTSPAARQSRQAGAV